MGMLIYRGPSLLDSVSDNTGRVIVAGTEIVVLATFAAGKTANSKTGGEIQTYIIRADMKPSAAIADGADTAVCGDCIHRSVASGGGGTCYAHHVARRGGNATYNQFAAGRSDSLDLEQFRGRVLRLGAYGDPAAVPFEAWQPLLAVVDGWTGYTHQWRRCDQRLRDYCMASCDNADDLADADAAGWRAYVVHPVGTPRPVGTVPCPAPRIKCEDCRKCSGVGLGRRGHVSIAAHGATAKRFTGIRQSLPLTVVA